MFASAIVANDNSLALRNRREERHRLKARKPAFNSIPWPGRPARTFHEKGHRTRRSRIEIRACNNQGKPKSLGFREDEGRGKVSSFPPISRRSAFALGSYRRASPVAGEELSPVTPRGDRHDSRDCNRPERAA